jgi:hypothetical protein
MPSITLAESAKLTQNQLSRGVIESIITVDRFYNILPFQTVEGTALVYNRENALGDVQYLGVGGTITAKAAQTYNQITASLTTLIGDSTINGLIQSTRSNFMDLKAAGVMSKAKSIGRTFSQSLITGAGGSNEITGILSLVAGGQVLPATAVAGDALSLEKLDALLDMVKDKDGQVDFLIMNSRTLRSYYALLRALGGATINEVVTLPDGTQVPAYRNVPIFRNDYVPLTLASPNAAVNTCTAVIAGTLDDGSQKYGIAGLTAANESGVRVEEVGLMEDADEYLTRVKFYCGLANFNTLGLAVATGITN